MSGTRFTIVAMLALLLVPGGGVIADSTTSPRMALTAARDDLAISELTLRRIERNLRELREASNADPLVMADYVRYLEAVRAMTERQRRVVAEMESLHRGEVPIVRVAEWPQAEPAPYVPMLPPASDEIARLEKELADSLAAFDEYLLVEQEEAVRRMERVDAASSAEMTDLAQEAAAAVERLRQRGIEIDTSAPPGEQSPSESGEGQGEKPCEGDNCPGCEQCAPGEPLEGEQEGEPGQPGSESQQSENESESGDLTGGGADGTGEGVEPPAGTPGSAGEGGNTIPPVRDRPPANDDDIVARQLREAAERETDPVLKEKLWQEYERYKGGR